MIITDKFVHIANPKCGSTFSRKVIRRGYEIALHHSVPGVVFKEIALPVARGNLRQGTDHHGTVQQIPRSLSQLQILSSVRHPVSLAQSTYALGLWWKRMMNEPRNSSTISHSRNTFCIETFFNYLETTMMHRWGISTEEHGVGYFTAHFITMFSSDPKRVFDEAREGNFTVERIEQSLPDIRFHRQETLEADLKRSLSTWIGCELAEEATKLNPTNVTKKELLDPIRALPSLSEKIIEKERSLFEVLARRGANYIDT